MPYYVLICYSLAVPNMMINMFQKNMVADSMISQQLTHKNGKNKHMSIHKDYKSISKVVLLAIHYLTQILGAR